jgi:catalase
MEEIAARVAKAPVMFDWFAQIAQPGDRTDDPSTPWPEDRQLVKLGTLTITEVAADQERLSRSLLFLPNNVPPDRTGRSDDRSAQRRLSDLLWRTSVIAAL